MSFVLIISAFLLAGSIVYFQYFYQQHANRDSYLLALLRFVSLFAVFLLLINPSFEQNTVEIKKPELFLGTDNSASISHANSREPISILRRKILNDEDLRESFEINDYLFGANLEADTVLDFKAQQTNIYKAIADVNALSSGQGSVTVLLTDGLQTLGRNYAYMNSSNPVYPVVIGDTVMKPDISISRINVNAFTTLGNNFPVEVFLNARVSAKVRSKFIVEHEGTELFSSSVDFSPDERSKQISFYLPAEQVGMLLYQAKLQGIRGEVELNNNKQTFGVEVLDEHSKISIVYSLLHPDLGMIKRAIETNRQRKVTLMHISEFDPEQNDDQLYVLYQPTRDFGVVFEKIENEGLSYFLIGGQATDWNFLNSVQDDFTLKVLVQEELSFPIFNRDFDTFFFEDIDFESFPPLLGSFGELTMHSDVDIMLAQKINDVATSMPLLATINDGNRKKVVLFGEDIWKWRSHSYELNGSFEKFDAFFNQLIQFLQLSERNKKMELYYKPVYLGNEPVVISVKNYDQNLNVALNSKLALYVNDSLVDQPFYVRNNSHEVKLNSLDSGTYNFKVVDTDAGQTVKGSFAVEAFSLEEAMITPDLVNLELLARNTKGRLFYPDQFDQIKMELLNNPNFRSRQIQYDKKISLIDWRWLLGLIVLSLSLEWLLRKYRGMV